jgi:phosphonate transport system substrate-binding protein
VPFSQKLDSYLIVYMSEPAPSSFERPGATHAKSNNVGANLARAGLYLALIAAIAVVSYAGYRASQEKSALRDRQDELVSTHGLAARTAKHLAPEYTDSTGRLLADPPKDADKLLDPDALVVAHYQDAAAAKQAVDWEQFRTFLTQATGKKTIEQEYQNTADDVAAVKGGSIQIVALHAADTPYVVNHAGFIPVAVLGNDMAAHGNRLDVAVRSDSSVKTLADIKGHTLTCTAPDSITGYRAAVAMLSQDAGLRPDVDYFISFSHGQKRSIEGLKAGEFEIAALSDDKVQSLQKAGSLAPADCRIVYQSEVIPRLTIGYVYNLKPELAVKVTKAILDFKNEKGAQDEDSGESMRFYPVDYMRDFEFVRRIDDSFDPRFSKAPKNKRDSSSP